MISSECSSADGQRLSAELRLGCLPGEEGDGREGWGAAAGQVLLPGGRLAPQREALIEPSLHTGRRVEGKRE